MWEVYQAAFTKTAFEAGASIEYIEACLCYAHNLHSNGVAIVYDAEHFSKLVGYSNGYIYGVANKPNPYYRRFEISKRNGKRREISEPLPSLKHIQRWILDNILVALKTSKFSKAYSSGSSILHNARFHKRQKYVLKLDIKNFFPSITEKHVFKIFSNLGYTPALSVLFTKLCCRYDKLPQGSPTSPAISNLVLKEFDARIGGFCIKNKIRFTRYADDLTFSGDFKVSSVVSFCQKILAEYGFQLNHEKTRLMEQHQRQEVTGIVVNKKLSVPRKLKSFLRKEAYYINKFGLQAHLSNENITTPSYIFRLLGLVNFALNVSPHDSQLHAIQAIFRHNCNTPVLV